MSDEGLLYVQYGCGDCAPREWVNFDASPRLRVEKLPIIRHLGRLAAPRPFPSHIRWGNISRGLPIADSAAKGVYCSHVLEHLPRNNVPAAFTETLRILAPGGRFRLIVPDLQWRARRYVEAAALGDPAAADGFLASCMLGSETRPRGALSLARRSYGLSAHLWMYDFAAIKSQLERVGFVEIRKCMLGDSGDPMFALVEDKDRFSEGREAELAVEAFRPV